MTSMPPEERSKQIADAARQYTATRLRPDRGLWLFVWLSLGGGLCAMLGTAFARVGRPESRAWHLLLNLAAIACFAGSLWARRWWPTRRGREALAEQLLRQQQEAGVVVEPVVLPALRWWFWPFAFLVAPGLMVTTLWLSFESPIRLQPLVVAGGFTVLGLAVAAAVRAHGRPRVRFGWLHLLPWTLYCGYALAAAAGLPQPLAQVAWRWQPAAWSARLMGPLLVVILIAFVVQGIDGRRQLRRLQKLVSDVSPAGTDGTD
jgi:hypothetical protein